MRRYKRIRISGSFSQQKDPEFWNINVKKLTKSPIQLYSLHTSVHPSSSRKSFGHETGMSYSIRSFLRQVSNATGAPPPTRALRPCAALFPIGAPRRRPPLRRAPTDRVLHHPLLLLRLLGLFLPSLLRDSS